MVATSREAPAARESAASQHPKFKDILTQRREELGLTQAEVARALGLRSAEYIGMLERGIRTLELSKVPLMADVLKMERIDLIRISMFEQLPLVANTVFGKGVRYAPVHRMKHVETSTVTVSEEAKEVLDRLYALPSDVRADIVSLISKFFLAQYTPVNKAF